jgi:hypothetical protein
MDAEESLAILAKSPTIDTNILAECMAAWSVVEQIALQLRFATRASPFSSTTQ